MGTLLKPRIVLSGVNFVEGGPLAVFHDALNCLSDFFSDRYDITALVHRRELFAVPNISYLEFPNVKRSWFNRVRFEYGQCRGLSEELQPFLWLSMHDMTPNVSAEVQAVYCHNPAPFYDLPLQEALLDPRFFLFRSLYRFLYRINIARNDFVVVQQEWMRHEFVRHFPVKQVIVAHPSLPKETLSNRAGSDATRKYVFFYPALPRTFKNFELLLRAAEALEEDGSNDFEVRITVDGSENRYTAGLRQKFNGLRSVSWLGLQTRKRVHELYSEADCLIFPSKLETWGMPISEWKLTGKPMLVADLPYAHETVGAYEKVTFVDTVNATALATQMASLVRGELTFEGSDAKPIAKPFASDWFELFQLLLTSTQSAGRGV